MPRSRPGFLLSSALILLVVASTSGTVMASASQRALGGKVKWPEFHGTHDNRGFNRLESTVGPGNVSSLGLSWIGNGASQEEDLVFNSSPVLAKGLVFFGTSAGQVLAFRATGCGDSECFPVWRSQLPQGIFSTPAYYNGMLYVGTTSPEGALYAFTAAGCGHPTCSPIWSSPLEVTGSSPKVAHGVLYVGGLGGVYAYDPAGCGQPICSALWLGKTGSAVDAAAAVAGGVVYVGSEDGKLYAFDAAGCGQATCQATWKGKTAAAIYDSSPAVAGGFVYVGSFWDGRLNVFHADGCGNTTCQPVWKGDADQYLDSAPAVAYGKVYLGTGHGELRVFDANGCGAPLCQPQWIGMAAGPVAAMNSAPTVANGVVYVGENNQRVYAFPAKGCGQTLCDKLWEFITQDPIVNSSPVMLNGTLYVSGTNFGALPELYVFELPHS